MIPENAPIGQHLMRIKTNWNAGVPDDACEETQYGVTEDYTANIVESLSITDLDMSSSELVVYSNNNKDFVIKLLTGYSDTLNLRVYDTNGKLISTNSLEKSTSISYIHNLDMGQVSPGVYLIQLGNSNTGFKTSRIIVK